MVLRGPVHRADPARPGVKDRTDPAEPNRGHAATVPARANRVQWPVIRSDTSRCGAVKVASMVNRQGSSNPCEAPYGKPSTSGRPVKLGASRSLNRYAYVGTCRASARPSRSAGQVNEASDSTAAQASAGVGYAAAGYCASTAGTAAAPNDCSIRAR